MLEEALEKKVEDLKVEGWKVDEEQGETKVLMKKPDYGSFGAHALIALLTIWWTLGLGNVLYAAKRYWMNSDKRIVRSEDIE